MIKFDKVSVIVLALAVTFSLAGVVVALAPGAIVLGTAANFAVLAGSGITNVPTSVIVGSAGSSPTPANALPGVTGGTNYTALDAAVTAAKVALSTAYADAANQTTHPWTTQYDPIKIFSTPTTLFPGVYNDPESFQITSVLTLDGGGDPNAVFIFQAGSTLNFTGGTVALTNGTQACNVFWQVGSSATFTAAATVNTIKGTILAKTDISDAGGSIVDGRLLADADHDTTGAVALNATHVTVPTCTGRVNVIKSVVGGPAVPPATFSIHVKDSLLNEVLGSSGTQSPQPGVVSPGTAYDLPAATYTVSETSDPDLSANYTTTFSGVCDGSASVILNANTNLPCTITNTYKTPNLTLDKQILGGGPNAESAWTLTATGPTTITGTGATEATDVVSGVDGVAEAQIGTYTLSESPATTTNYTASAWSCVGNTGALTVTNASVVIAPNDDVVCTITNTYVPPVVSHSSGGGRITSSLPATLTVIKQVVNNSGGTATASSFNLHVKNTGVDVLGSPAAGVIAPGIYYSLSPTTYVVSEDPNASYTQTFSGDCDSNGSVTLISGSNKTCTITNDDIAHMIVPKLPKTGFTTALTLGQQVKTIESSLRKGNRGVNITTLQLFLISENKGSKAVTLKDSGADGKFGPITKAALAEWQTANGLVGDGIFGKKTRAYLSAHY